MALSASRPRTAPQSDATSAAGLNELAGRLLRQRHRRERGPQTVRKSQRSTDDRPETPRASPQVRTPRETLVHAPLSPASGSAEIVLTPPPCRQTLGRRADCRESARHERPGEGAFPAHPKRDQEGRDDEPACKPDSVTGLAPGRRPSISGPPLPTASCGLPAGSGGPPSNACARPRPEPRTILALLRVGFT